MQLAAIKVPNSLHGAGQVNQPSTAQDLARTRLDTEPGREVQDPTVEPALDGHRLTGVQPDPDGEWEIRGGPRCLEKARLQLDRRPDGLTGGTEHREGFVPSQLDHGPVPSPDVLSDDIGEPRGQSGRRLIAPLKGERGVSADVRDEKGPDLSGRFVRSRVVLGVAATPPGRSMGGPTDLTHAAEYPTASWPPDPGVVLSPGHGLQS